MEIFWYVIIGIFGAIIGSFLNVVIYRLHTEKSLNGHSHCLSCGTSLSWYELFPLLSYLLLRGQCRHCHSWIPARYLFVEALTALSFVLLWHLLSSNLITFAIHAILTSLLIVIGVYDMRHTIIPDELSIAVGAVAGVFLIQSLILGQGITQALTSIAGGLGAGFFIGGLWYISKGRWIGLGDAKLALPLGIIVGYPAVFSMMVLSFWIGAFVSVVLLILQVLLKKGKTTVPFLPERITIKSEVPFAPFLILGFFVVQLFHADILNITYAIFSLS